MPLWPDYSFSRNAVVSFETFSEQPIRQALGTGKSAFLTETMQAGHPRFLSPGTNLAVSNIVRHGKIIRRMH